MLDLQRYAFYDAKRTMRLTLEPVSILEMLQDLPGELLFRRTVAGSQVRRRRLRIHLEAGSHPRPGMRDGQH